MTAPVQQHTKQRQRNGSGSNHSARADFDRGSSTEIGRSASLWIGAAVLCGVISLASVATANVPLGSGVAVAVLTLGALTDVRHRRLPDRVVIAAAIAFAALTAIEFTSGHIDVAAHHMAANIGLGIGAMAGPLLALHLIAPSSMGFGDVKAAAVLGGAVGAVDWKLALIALALASGASAAVAIVRRVSTIALGPGLVGAAAVALIAHPILLTTVGPPPAVSAITAMPTEDLPTP